MPPPRSDASAGNRTRRRYAPRMAPGQRREQVLDAALQVIVEQGYEGVSIEAIARTAGVTRPVIYDHFPNLAGLLQSLIEREERIALGQMAEVLPSPELHGSADPVTALASAVRRFLEAVASRPPTWQIILLPLDGTPAIVREHVETNRIRIRSHLETLVRWGVGDAASSGAIDIEIAAQSIMTLAEEAGRRVLTDPGQFSPERYERFAASVVGRLAAGTP